MEALGKIADGIGQPVRRKEDSRLLTGKGSLRRRYPADPALRIPEALFADVRAGGFMGINQIREPCQEYKPLDRL
jgi:hypothetical protein